MKTSSSSDRHGHLVLVGHQRLDRGRNVSTFEAIVGGSNSRQLKQPNNIHIACANDDGWKPVLGLERLTGVTVPAQAKRCAEFQDLFRVSTIPGQFS